MIASRFKTVPFCTASILALGRAPLKGMLGAARPKASGALEKQKRVLLNKAIKLQDYTYIALLVMTEIRTWRSRRKAMTGETRCNRKITRTSATLSATNPRKTLPESNLGLGDEEQRESS